MADPRTLDNPNDIAIRESQKQQRLAHGVALANRTAKAAATPTEFAEPFTFRFRKIKNGSFAGLWELAALKPSGKVDEIIVDADALPNVLDMIGNIFENKGY